MIIKKYYIYLILLIIIICISLFILKQNKKELFTSDNTNSEIDVRYIEDGISRAIDINDGNLDDYNVHNSHIFPNNFRPNIQEILDSDDTKILHCEGTYEPCSPPCGSNSIQRSNNDDCPIKRCQYTPCNENNQEHEKYCKYSEGIIEVGDCSVDCDYGVKPIINKPKNENCDNIINYEYCLEKHCPINCDGNWSQEELLKSKKNDYSNQDLSVVGNNSDLIRVKVWEGETEGKYGGTCNALTDIGNKFNYNNIWYRYDDNQPRDCEGSWEDQCTKIDDNQNANIDSVFINANKWVGETQGTHDGLCVNLNDITNKFTYDNNYYKLGNCPQPVDCQGEWGDCENGILNGNNSNFKTYNITRESQNDGKICDFSNGETKTDGCNQPVDCEYTWSNWGVCNKLCDTGTQQQTIVINQEPLDYGDPCPIDDVITQNCNTNPCNENTHGCNYSNWTDDGTCSKPCGGGELIQKKTSNNGCTELTQNVHCNTHNCDPIITADYTSNTYSDFISYKFTGDGSFTPQIDINNVEILVVGGGGGGSGGTYSSWEGAGGGAGGLIFKNIDLIKNTKYNIKIGKGGKGGIGGGINQNKHPDNGEDSFFIDDNTSHIINLIAKGGGGGGYERKFHYNATNIDNGRDGGSGGGGKHLSGNGGNVMTSSGSITTSQNIVNQVGTFGHEGGTTSSLSAGGGGAGEKGDHGGGDGKKYNLIDGSVQWYAGGGGAGKVSRPGGRGGGGKGSVRGGNGGKDASNAPNAGETNGAVHNKGGGGGGGSGKDKGNGGSGGDGVVIIKYLQQL